MMKFVLANDEVVTVDLCSIEQYLNINLNFRLTDLLILRLGSEVLGQPIPYRIIMCLYDELRSGAQKNYDKYGLYGNLDYTAICQLKDKLDNYHDICSDDGYISSHRMIHRELRYDQSY